MSLLERLLNATDQIVENVAEFHINEAKAVLLNRVFEENKNEAGQSLGKYKSKAYIAYRNKLGRQTNVVDLQLKGNLLASIDTSKVSDGFELIYKSDEQAKIGQYQNERYNSVFKISEKENEQLINKSLEYLNELNNSIFIET